MPIFANIVKPGTRKEEEVRQEKPLVNSLKSIHEMHLNKQAGAILEKPKRKVGYQEINEINIKKTSRYLEDLTTKGD
jgi:hypothetical protein